jgi:hypothetical protein
MLESRSDFIGLLKAQLQREKKHLERIILKAQKQRILEKVKQLVMRNCSIEECSDHLKCKIWSRYKQLLGLLEKGLEHNGVKKAVLANLVQFGTHFRSECERLFGVDEDYVLNREEMVLLSLYLFEIYRLPLDYPEISIRDITSQLCLTQINKNELKYKDGKLNLSYWNFFYNMEWVYAFLNYPLDSIPFGNFWYLLVIRNFFTLNDYTCAEKTFNRFFTDTMLISFLLFLNPEMLSWIKSYWSSGETPHDPEISQNPLEYDSNSKSIDEIEHLFQTTPPMDEAKFWKLFFDEFIVKIMCNTTEECEDNLNKMLENINSPSDFLNDIEKELDQLINAEAAEGDLFNLDNHPNPGGSDDDASQPTPKKQKSNG